MVKTCILIAMGSIHNRAIQKISVRMSQQLWNRGWGYLPIGKALEDAAL